MARRLLLSYLAVIGVTVALLAAIIQIATLQTFSRYLSNQAAAHSEMLPVMLAGYYAAHGTWEGIEPNVDQASLMIGAQITLADAQGRIVVASQRVLIGRVADADLGLAIPVMGSGGTTVGTLYVGRSVAQQRADAAFLNNITRALMAAGSAAAVLAVGLGVLLARSMTHPLAEMSQAAERIAAGDYAVRVSLRGPKEVTGLASAFNQMAEAMASLERLRRELVANVSHDLRTPLTVIQGYLEGLRFGQIADRRSAELAFEAMHTEVARLLRLVNDLRQVAALDAGEVPLERQLVAVADLVSDALRRIEPLASAKGVAAVNQTPTGLPAVNVDADRIGQVLFNLLDNALRYTPSGGTIVVQAGHVESNPGEQPYVWLAVQDNGRGIALEHLPHVFERFYRADRARSRATDRTQDEGGAGLGLAIARAIVAAHGGQISADSDGVPGHGSIFTLRLPL